jgi:hypothetical protein
MQYKLKELTKTFHCSIRRISPVFTFVLPTSSFSYSKKEYTMETIFNDKPTAARD